MATAWQTKLSSFTERNLYAYNKSLFCDVDLSVMDAHGDKVTVSAHKYVLAISSPVFEAMFYGELAETGPTIDLPDCTEEGLQEMLRYVYADEVNLTGSNVLEVLYLAEKYMLPFLKEKCEEYLDKELEPEDVFHVLPQIRDEKVEKKCWDVVDSDTEKAVSSESFLNISKEMLIKVLGRDTLSIDEIVLFQAIEKWASNKLKEQGLEENKKNKRAVLGKEVIKLIRFPLMSETEFAEKVLPTRILKSEEITEVIQIFKKLAPLTVSFSNKKRVSNLKCLRPKTRFDSIQAPSKLGWRYGRRGSDAICLQVNKPLFLAGVRLFGNKDCPHTVTMTLYKNDAKVTHICSSISFASQEMDGYYIGGYYGFDVMLDDPIALDPDDVYTIEANISGPDSYYGEKGKTIVIFENFILTYHDSLKSTNGTSRERGQFHSFLFKTR